MKKILFFLVFSFVFLLGSQAIAQTTLTGGSSNDTFKEGVELIESIKLFYRELSTNGNGNINPDAQTQFDVQANTVLVLEIASRNDIASLDQFYSDSVSGVTRNHDTAVVNNAYDLASEYYVRESQSKLGSTINIKNNDFLTLLHEKISK